MLDVTAGFAIMLAPHKEPQPGEKPDFPNIGNIDLAAPRDAAQAVAKAGAAIASSGLKLRKGDKNLESAADIEAYVKEPRSSSSPTSSRS